MLFGYSAAAGMGGRSGIDTILGLATARFSLRLRRCIKGGQVLSL